MKREQRIVFEGKTYRLSGNYYRRNVWGSPGPSSLHRAIWQSANGQIPEGFEIHHVDGDTFNNELENLELVDASKHQREHALLRHSTGELKAPTASALDAAAKWHASPEGLAWHATHSVESWGKRKWALCACQNCGASFMSPYPSRAKWCHLNCKMSAYRKKIGKAVGTRPGRVKQIELDGKRKPPSA